MNKVLLEKIIKDSLVEDIGHSDISSQNIFSENDFSEARLVSKDNGIICGTEVFKKVYEIIDDLVKIKFRKKDGNRCLNGDIIADVKGKTGSVLKGERTALNFIQHMSGIASMTKQYSDIASKYGVKIADTRKTLPNLRMIQKYAVKTGGGINHRFGLYDAVMIKDNHIKAAGSISKAVKKVRVGIGFTVKIEVETSCLKEIKEALDSKADIIMLDNFKPDRTLAEALKLIGDKALSEISGNITLDNLEEYCRYKPDIISVGSLTHSVRAFDISMKFL